MKNATVHVRVNEELKSSVENILDELGISLSYSINMFLKQIVLKRGIPFEAVLPSEEKSKEIELLASSINNTGGSEVSSYANKIISLYASDVIDYETAVFALGRKI